MAACLLFWFGQVPCQEKGIKLFLKLGGKFVGKLKKPDKSLSAFLQVRNLQRQVATFLPHPTRPANDILLFVHNVRVGPPGMAYLDDLDEEASLQVQSLLQGCTTMEVMYDESDEYAKQVLKQANVHVSQDYFPLQTVFVVAGQSMPKEVTYLTRHGVTNWEFGTWYGKYFVQDFGFLKDARLDSLSLRDVTPTQWSDCNAKRLSIAAQNIDCQAFKTLDGVEELQLWVLNWDDRNITNWEGLHNFPNLNHLRLRCDLSRRDVQDLASVLAGMPKIKTFYFDGHAHASLLANLQHIQHLSSCMVNLHFGWGPAYWTCMILRFCFVVAVFWVASAGILYILYMMFGDMMFGGMLGH